MTNSDWMYHLSWLVTHVWCITCHDVWLMSDVSPVMMSDSGLRYHLSWCMTHVWGITCHDEWLRPEVSPVTMCDSGLRYHLSWWVTQVWGITCHNDCVIRVYIIANNSFITMPNRLVGLTIFYVNISLIAPPFWN